MYLVHFHRYRHYCFRVENPVFRVPSRFLVKMSLFLHWSRRVFVCTVLPVWNLKQRLREPGLNIFRVRRFAVTPGLARAKSNWWPKLLHCILVHHALAWLSLHRKFMLLAFSRFSIRFVPLFRWLMLTPMCFSETKPIIQRHCQYNFSKCFGRIPLCVIPIILC